jgi:hypothetical protein
MSTLLMQLRSSYDVILLDTPPLTAGVDPLALGTLTGSLLLVVRTGATERETTEAKLDVLERLPIRLLGAVLNDVPPGGLYRQYYSYYAPGYEAWDEEESEARVQVWTPSGESVSDEEAVDEISSTSGDGSASDSADVDDVLEVEPDNVSDAQPAEDSGEEAEELDVAEVEVSSLDGGRPQDISPDGNGAQDENGQTGNKSKARRRRKRRKGARHWK